MIEREISLRTLFISDKLIIHEAATAPTLLATFFFLDYVPVFNIISPSSSAFFLLLFLPAALVSLFIIGPRRA